MTDTVEAKDTGVKDIGVKDIGVKDIGVNDTEVRTSNMETHSALPAEETERLSGEIVAALKTVFDPEIPADIYELGLIYKVDLKDDRSVDVMMTLTTPNCPAAGELPQMVENAIASVPGIGVVNVNLVWDPAWTPDRMSDEARLVLNMW
jgi:FeS assembly SUF system protein